MTDWEEDCLRWRGKILTGKYAHWCLDWDGLPIDETTPEWPCVCKDDIDQQIAAGTWGEGEKTND